MAGFLKELERSNCISLKTVPGSGSLLWVAGIYSCLVVVLCCVCRGLGVLWGFQVVSILSDLRTLQPPSPTALVALPAGPTSWEGFAPCL